MHNAANNKEFELRSALQTRDEPQSRVRLGKKGSGEKAKWVCVGFRQVPVSGSGGFWMVFVQRVEHLLDRFCNDHIFDAHLISIHFHHFLFLFVLEHDPK